MLIESLLLAGYRNYKQLHCRFSPGVNLFMGANAQGKTNLIESIYYLSVGKAYRQARDEQLILWGDCAFQIKGEIDSRKGKAQMEIRYRQGESPPKALMLNGLRKQKWEEMSGALTSVLFSPESMAIIKGSPQERRNFLDYDISQVSLAYSADLYKYRRVLAQRNALLKRIGPLPEPLSAKRETLSIWDGQLITYGSRIIEKRLSFIEKMTPLVRLTHRRLTEGKENMEIQYLLHAKSPLELKKNSDGKIDISEFLKEARDHALEEDLRLKSTQWGPHRDDVKVLLNGMEMRQYGSQGQQRTGILALKLAELEIFRGESGEYPILLLDDVLSELDENRQQQLLTIVNEKAVQCVITATDEKIPGMREIKKLKKFDVHKGEVRERH
ncbi:MAG: DNA replication/repair protein RecF [Clostridiales bacterium]|nr:DNA replication/repair protein RecF [Clostridiales bacterium]